MKYKFHLLILLGITISAYGISFGHQIKDPNKLCVRDAHEYSQEPDFNNLKALAKCMQAFSNPGGGEESGSYIDPIAGRHLVTCGPSEQIASLEKQYNFKIRNSFSFATNPAMSTLFPSLPKGVVGYDKNTFLKDYKDILPLLEKGSYRGIYLVPPITEPK